MIAIREARFLLDNHHEVYLSLQGEGHASSVVPLGSLCAPEGCFGCNLIQTFPGLRAQGWDLDAEACDCLEADLHLFLDELQDFPAPLDV